VDVVIQLVVVVIIREILTIPKRTERFQWFLTMRTFFESEVALGASQSASLVAAAENLGSSPTGTKDANGITLFVHKETHDVDLLDESCYKF